MFIVNKKFTRAWEPVTEAATGDTFAVQPLLRDIEYIVLDRARRDCSCQSAADV